MKAYKILVVDDNVDNSEKIIELLNDNEKIFTFFQALNGKIACSIAEKKLPDLIITDWEMPVMDGITLIKYLKSVEKTKEIPIIMCTGVMTTSENLKTAIDAGAVDYIRKPVEKLELTARVYSMLKLSNSMKQIMEQNAMLEQQKEEITASLETVNEQKEKIGAQAQELQQSNQALNLAYIEIHKKNESVTASINYAKRIQNAILPFEELIEKSLGKDNFFILFKPKDIVSGDFYWFEEVQTQTETIKFVAVADCTGHGVPGAFMSMIGNQLLHEIIIKNHIYSPDLILNNLHKEVHRVLRQKETNTNDGMDMVIIAIRPSPQGFENLAGLNIEYAGAMNPLYYVQNNELKEIKATKRAIGGKQSEGERFFEKHTLQLVENREQLAVKKLTDNFLPITDNCTLYLCTDGYQDQFGGEQNRKFMLKKLRELLLSISKKSMHEQRRILSETFDIWKGEHGQIDDVTIVGVRF